MPRDGSFLPLFGRGNKGVSAVVSAQRRVNLYTAVPQDPDRGQLVLYPRPGLQFYGSGNVLGGFPNLSNDQRFNTGLVRGMMDGEMAVLQNFSGQNSVVPSGYLVIGDTLNQLAPFGMGTAVLFAMNTSSGRVMLDHNDTQVLVVDGTNGYVLNTVTNVMAVVTDPNFPQTARSCAFLAGRGVLDDPAFPGRFRWTNLNDFTTCPAANFATAELAPDPLVAVWVSNGLLNLFGDYTVEFWAPSQGSQPYSRVSGSAAPWGLVAIGSLKRVGRATLFLGRDYQGNVKVLSLTGYDATPVSTSEVEWRLKNEVAAGDLANGTAMAYTTNGHTMYRLSFANLTLSYDTTENVWNDETSGAAGGRFKGQYGALIAGTFYVSDYAAQKVYKQLDNVYTDDGDVISREVITKHSFVDEDRTSLDALCLDLETGVGLTLGQGVDPQVMLKLSRDRGHTWGNEMTRSFGKIGEYVSTVWWNSLGRGRDLVSWFKITDPVKTVMTNVLYKVRA